MHKENYNRKNNNYRSSNSKKPNHGNYHDGGGEHKMPSVFRNLNKYDSETTNKTESRKPYNRSNNKNYKNNKTRKNNKFNGFSNRIKFKHVDPCGYTKQALRDYLYDNNPSDENIAAMERVFRSKLFDNYHLYEIRVSNENHFNSGYSFIHVGWMAASKEPSTEAVNISIWFTEDAINTIPSNIRDIIYFKSVTLANQLFMSFGKFCRILLDGETYKKQARYLKSWIIDNKPHIFSDVFGNIISGNEENIILINKTVGMGVKIGLGMDTYLMDLFRDKYNLITKIIPFSGIALYENSSEPKTKYSPENLVATINKCNKKGEINYACETRNSDFIRDLIEEGITYENSKHHNVYSTPRAITHSSEDPSFGKNQHD